MFVAPINTDLLLSEAEKENLYDKLIEQINKDFNFANEAIDFPKSTSPEELKIQLKRMNTMTTTQQRLEEIAAQEK